MSCKSLFTLSLFLPWVRVVAKPQANALAHGICWQEAQCLIQSDVHVNQRVFSALGVGGGRVWLPAKPGDELQEETLQVPATNGSSGASGNTSESPNKGPESWQKALSLKANKTGDLIVLGLSALTDVLALLVCISCFVLFRRFYPELYENNARSLDEGGLNTAPSIPDEGFWGWARSALAVTREEMRQACGVDEMMLIEFSTFSMRLLLLLGIPLVCILCPLHLILGGAEVDSLSKIGMANVKYGSPLLWVHAFTVWIVVMITENQVHNAMRRFLHVRVRWLLELEPPRSTTVLVENIPECRRSDAELQAYFEMLFPNCVESVHLVKKTRWLRKLTQRLETAQLRLEEAMFKWQREGEDKDLRPVFHGSLFMWLFGSFVTQNDKILYYKELVSTLQDEATAERERVLKDSQEPMVEAKDESGNMQWQLSEKAAAVNAAAGFVTFTSEREARLMLGTRCTASAEDFIAHVPPHHSDVIYEDMQVPLTEWKISHLMGYACVIGVFLSFLPLTCGIGSLASIETLERHWEIGDRLEPEAIAIYEGIVSSLVLTTFMSFLPTILMWVFSTFFILRAHAWAQLKLQTWLFWFNLIFVVLVTSLGGTLLGRIKEMVYSPLAIFTVLADSLPRFTHFYLNYMLMQWVIHALNLTRYIQLIKYFVWRTFVGPKRAVPLTEPEDQDYYGIGSRSAAWTINLVIAVVFCTLCPIITIITIINFLITRVVYGYLVVFAETKKPDLGGPFFVTQLWHVQYGLMVYVLLMIGVLWHRSQNNIAMICVVSPAAIYVLTGVWHFYTRYHWEALPFEELCTDDAVEDFADQIERYRFLGENRPTYMQKEMKLQTQCPDTSLEDIQQYWMRARPGSPHMSDNRRRRREVPVTACEVNPGQVVRRPSMVLDAGFEFLHSLTQYRDDEEDEVVMGSTQTLRSSVASSPKAHFGDRMRRMITS